MNEQEFVETVLFPAFNDNDLLHVVEEAFGNPEGEGNQVLNIETTEGEYFQVTIAKRSGPTTRLAI